MAGPFFSQGPGRDSGPGLHGNGDAGSSEEELGLGEKAGRGGRFAQPGGRREVGSDLT